MAKVQGPLMSMGARGAVGKAIVFGVWKGIAWVREWFKPQNPKDPLQVNQRGIFTMAVARWHDLTDEIQTDWQTAIERKGETMSGFNFFTSEYIGAMRLGEVPSDTPPDYLLP